MMKRLVGFCFFAGIFLSSFSQDTVYIDLNRAMDIAVANNLQIINSIILLQQPGNNSKLSSFDIGSTDIDYKYGQLYTPEKGWLLEVNQNFGNSVYKYREAKAKEIAGDINRSINMLNNKTLEITIKSTYLEWLYQYNILDNINTIREYMSKSLYVSGLKKELGDIEPIKELRTRSWVSEVETQYLECTIEIDVLQNKLKKLLNTKDYIMPQNRRLELYMVQKQDDTSAYHGNFITDIQLEKFNYSQALIKSQKAKLAPSLKAGVFVQNINPQNTTTGVMAGISVPLWFFPKVSEVKNAEVQSQIEYNNYKQSIENSKLDIQNLLLELDKWFMRG